MIFLAFVRCSNCEQLDVRCEQSERGGYACSLCLRKKKRCSHTPRTEHSRTNPRIDKDKKPAGSRKKASQSSTVEPGPITAYFRNDPVDDLRTRLTRLEARVSLVEAGNHLYTIKAEPEIPVLVFAEGPVAGPSGSGDVEMGPSEESGPVPEAEQPEEQQPDEEMPEEGRPEEEGEKASETAAVPDAQPDDAAPVSIPDEERAVSPANEPEGVAPAEVVKPEPREPRIPAGPPMRIKARKVQGSFEDKKHGTGEAVEVEYIEIMSD
jgi:hypothetical protein